MISKYGLFNFKCRTCTRELKIIPMHAYVRDVLGWKKKDYCTAIGIRADESHRMSFYKQYGTIIYPLVTMLPTVLKTINQFWHGVSFRLKLKSYEGNCDLCPLKSDSKLKTICKEKPQRIVWWYYIEKKYENFIPESKKHNQKLKPPLRLYRGYKSILDIYVESQKDFKPANDESIILE